MEGVAKKKTLVATEQRREDVQAEREQFRHEMAEVDAKDMVYVDESGVTTSLTRLYGRAPRGQRVVDHVPHGHWKVLTILGALTSEGIQAAMTVDSATDSEVFRTYVEQVLIPVLRPGQVVILDNLQAHKAAGVQEAIAAVGCRVRYLPPYSPDLNPIEPAWSKLKSYLRAVKARARGVLDEAVAAGLQRITAQDARGYITHCGYSLQ
jgi:transposase